MERVNPMDGKVQTPDLTEFVIRVGIVAILLIWAIQVVKPFTGLLLWGLVLAVTLYPLNRRLAAHVGGRQGRAATLIVLAGLLLVGVPSVLLGSSFAGRMHDFYIAFQNDQVAIAAPAASVAEWPLIGKKVYATWESASRDLPAMIERLRPQLAEYAKVALGMAASTLGSVGLFLASLIVAGIMMAFGESGSRSILRILQRVAGKEEGEKLHKLTTGTTRSVAAGVLGVAVIQAIILGIGFIWAGVPGAGVLALLVLVIGIMQLPATLITLPVIGYLWWSGDSTVMNIVFTIYLVVGGLADNVLKPLLLGRGVDAPMPIILIGALGGMVTAGFIGLFLGAVVLAVAYDIFMAWVAKNDTPDADPGPEEPTPVAD